MKLIAENIVKFYPEKEVLKGISFEMNAGDSLAVIGESGCGKSTLIKIIAGLLKATSGTVEILENREKFSPKIGYAFQLNALFDSYTIWQNIAFKEYIENALSKKALLRRVYEVLKLVNLEPSVARLFPRNLSGGMQKRVAIARAIFNSPHLLFLDEPTSGLDPYTSVKIVDTINSIQTPEGRTPLKISIVHDMKIVKAISNKVLFIKNGKINWFGFVEDLENEAVENVDLKAFISHI